MKAMILAAGFGTRLLPLTQKRPKALMPVANRPILAWVVDYLKIHGCTEIIVNTHHHYEQVLDYVPGCAPPGVRIETIFEPVILGTGGGIKNTEDFWDQDFFAVINVDILTDIDLQEVFDQHRKSGALVTLVVHDRPPFNQVAVDSSGNITDIGKTNSPGRLAFTGIHIIHPEVLSFIPKGIFSDIIDCYRKLITDGKAVKTFMARNHYWQDVGTLNSYMEANRDFAGKPFIVGSGSVIHPSALLEDWAVVGENCIIERDARIERSVLWNSVEVKAGIRICDSVVSSCEKVTADLNGEIFSS
jgi:NDP-sugar pyrophosphorylase family protein